MNLQEGIKITKGMPRTHKCRFNCHKAYAMEWARNNHETNCNLNPNKGIKPRFVLINERWVFKGGK